MGIGVVQVQFLTESIIYRLLHWLNICYQGSCVKRILFWLAEACRNSLPGRWIKNTMARESAFQNSFIFRVLRAVLSFFDKRILKLSAAISKWSETSLAVSIFRTVSRASKERLFALAFPVFGTGYLAGRIFLGKLMIRDVLFLGLLFVIAGIVMIDREKRRALWKNSLFYQFCIILME